MAPGMRATLARQLQKQLFEQLTLGIRETVYEAENDLFDAVNQARDNEARTDCMDNIATFRSLKPKVIEGFLRAHLDAFNAYFSGKGAAGGQVTAQEKADLLPAGGLSLLKKEVQEENLLITTMASRLDKQYSLELVVMRRRLAHLAGKTYGDEVLTPWCPGTITDSLQHALHQLGVTVGLKTILYVHFEEQVMSGLQELYSGMSEFFQSNQVLPALSVDDILAEMSASRSQQISPRIKRQADKAADKKKAVSSPKQDGRLPGSPLGAHPAVAVPQQSGRVIDRTPHQQEIQHQVNDINQMLGSFRATSGVVLPSGSRMLDSFAPPGASQSYDQTQIMQALQSLQRQRAKASVDEQQSTDAFKQSMYEELAENNANSKDFKIGPEQSNLIDLVGMLFDFVKEEEQLSVPHKGMLTNLQNLYCQVALQDTEFFHDTQHPAHQLLNRMVQAGSQYQGETEQHQLSDAIEETVRQALVEYQQDEHVFERLLEQFDRQVGAVQRRVEKREKRAVEAAKGREKLVFARKHARGFVEGCIKRHGPPEVIRGFLQGAWTDVLVFYFLRTGPSSQPWQENAQIAERLAWSCTPLENQQRLEFAVEQPQLMGKIRQALEQLGCYSVAEIKQVLKDIQLCQQAIQEQQHEVVQKLNSTLASSISEEDEQELAEPAKVDESQLDTEAEQLMEKLRHVQFGTWFEFSAPSRTLKLAWFSPTTQRYMFVDSSGQGTEVLTLFKLFQQMQKGETKFVEQVEPLPFFERALQAIQRSLKNFTSSYLGEIRQSKPLSRS